MLVLAGFAVIAGGMYYVTHLPLPKLAPLSQTSFVYDANGNLLTTYQQENRTDVTIAQVPQVVIDAVVSTEDRNFFHEGAIDPLSVARALINDLFGSGGLEGGSTITQQYVKQAYLTPQRSLTRKLKEALLALQLERHESKDQILQNYLNTIYFGRGAYGIDAAGETYFGKPVEQLNLAEASLLAGMIRDPVDTDPSTHATIARDHQNQTLTAMVRDHQITGAAAAAVRATPFSSYVLSTTESGLPLTNTPGVNYYLDAVHQELLSTYGAAALRRGGLKVTTTLDPTLQTEAYNAVYGTGPDALNPGKGTPSGALVSINDSGDVVALVGGQNYSTSQVDLALGTGGGGSGRQPGSTFKALMLAELIKSGYSVQSTFPAPPEVVVPHGDANGADWTVTNFEGEAASDSETVLDATVYSINTVYAQIVERLGAASLDSMAESLGINPAELQGAYPSQVLGSADVSPLEMADAYATFADGGVYHSPVLITKVTGPNGEPLPSPKSTTRRVLTTDQAATETGVLEQVVASGTGTAAGGIGSGVAGKTGTTDSSADAWFIGYTP
ncbi:MAG: transglycosylase domain-containing protein, partial [Acidimicrobiales bacterium]